MQRKQKEKKKVDGSKIKIAVVLAAYNDDVTSGLLEGAISALKGNGVTERNTRTVKVPGSFEIPLACQRLARTKKYDGIIALGAVIKGGTDHYYYVSGETSRGIMDVMLRENIPIGFGVITTNNLEEALDRSRGKANKGKEAAEAVLSMIMTLGALDL